MNGSRVESMENPGLPDELKALIDPCKVLTGADALETYCQAWTRQFAPAPCPSIL
jgi:hypothetical protein